MKGLSEATVLFPYVLLLIALCGAMASWVKPAPLPLPGWTALVGIFAAMFGILFFGVWSGFATTADVYYASIGARVPHSDAGGYFLGVFEMGYAGRWAALSSNRPLAASFRNLIVGAAGLSYSWTIIIQTALLAAALSFAARDIARWLGPWSAFAFVGFMLIMIRPFMATTLTEPLALVVALCGIAFLSDALRTQRFRSALMALLCVTAAQVIRSGAIFLPFTMAAWVFLAHSASATWWRRLVYITSAVLAPVFLAEILRSLYALPQVSSSGNLAYVACAVARGTDWSECHQQLLARGVPRDAAVFMPALYDLAWQSFTADPARVPTVLWTNVWGYFSNAPRVALSSYTSIFSPPPWLIQAMLTLCAAGAAVQFYRSPRDIPFWLFALCGVAASAALMFGTDGWRTLYATHPLFVLFLAIGCRSGLPLDGHAINWRPALIATGFITAALILAPATLHRVMRHPPTSPEEFDARSVAGLIIVPDGARSPSVPSMSATEFARMVATTSLEAQYGPFVQPIIAQAPIALFLAAQLGSPAISTFIYFGPPTVLTSKTAKAWHFTYREPDWPQPPGSQMRIVDSATERE